MTIDDSSANNVSSHNYENGGQAEYAEDSPSGPIVEPSSSSTPPTTTISPSQSTTESQRISSSSQSDMSPYSSVNNATPPATTSTSSSFITSSPAPSVLANFPYKRIHPHCASCVRPHRCIRKPNFVLSSGLTSSTTGGTTTNTSVTLPNGTNCPTLTNEEIYSLILNVNYYANAYMLHHATRSNNNEASDDRNCGEHCNNGVDEDSIEHCPVVRCPNDSCAVILHYCKLPEHYLLCQYQKVPCLNHTYGCPYTILRKDIASHLKHCPANVVHCSMEWNRWPLHTTEKSPQTRVYCPPQALDIRNLDVALALRDQRMLKQLWSASRQMKRIMRGCLSTHPAVPIKPYIGVRTYREYSTNLVGSDPNSTLGGDAGDGTEAGAQVHIIHYDEERYIAYASKLVEAAYMDSLMEILKRSAQMYRKTYEHQRKMMTSVGPGGAYQGRKKSNSICQMTVTTPAVNGNGAHLNSCTSINGMLSTLLPVTGGGTLTSMPSSSSINLPIVSDSVIESAAEMKAAAEAEAAAAATLDASGNGSTGTFVPSGPAPPPPPPVPKCNALSLEVSIRSLAAYQPKPRAMYTFRCGLDFRVDECANHYRDIHSDIHGGLDGWIEHRCPLFQYGCNFVHRRWAPTTCGMRKTLVYNENLEAFACSSSVPDEEAEEVDDDDDYDESQKYQDFQIKSPSTGRKRGSSSSTSMDPDSSRSSRRSSNSTLTCCSGSVSYTNTTNTTGPWNSSKKYCSTMSLLSSSNCSSSLSSPMSSPCSSGYSPVSSPCASKCCRSHCPHLLLPGPPPPSPLLEYSLNDFPFEILQHICNFLDGYSLNNLSFATQRFRLVVQSFLKKKGYVQLQWRRYETDKGKYQWKVAYKKWMFSTAIEPITGWTMNSDNMVAEHLKTCPFNDRIIHQQPFKCMLLNQDSTVMMKRQRP